jgi:hypothetical protein
MIFTLLFEIFYTDNITTEYLKLMFKESLIKNAQMPDYLM